MTNYLNPVIKSYVKDVFKLTDHDCYILSEFAKLGETYRNRINLAHLSNRQVSRRVDALEKNKFLTKIKSTPYRNIEGKETTIFGLTFKGLLASLRHENLENTYLFKTYQKLIGTKISSDMIPFYVKYIKNSLIYFLCTNKIIGIKFDDMPNVANWFDNNFDATHISNHDIELLKKFKNNVDESYEDIERNIPDNIYEQEQIPTWQNLRNYWYHAIEKISEGKEPFKILSELRKEYPSEFENEIKRRELERQEYYQKMNKKVQLDVDKFLRRRKSTKYTK